MNVILIFTFSLLFSDCENNISTIQEVKGENREKYVNKTVTVEGFFVSDSMPMIVTDLKLVTINTPIPYNLYLIVFGDEIDTININKYGGSKIQVTGIIKRANKILSQPANEKVVMEVNSFKILNVSEKPYNPKPMKTDPDSSAE